jgi:O-antigen/teichoic acid export membrane protein
VTTDTVEAPQARRSLAQVGITAIPAVLDQALFATTNFVLSLQLARAVSRTDFGAFTLWLSVLVLLGMVYAAVVIGPMLVYATTRYADALPAYLGGLYRAHMPLVVLPAAGLLAVAGGLTAIGQAEAGAHLAGLAVAVPGVLLLWLARSACFVRPSTRYLAPVGGAVYLALVVVGTQVLGRVGLSGPGLFVVMGIAGLVCGAALLARLGVSPRRGLGFGELLASHRSFSSWLLAVTVVTWLMLNAYPFLIRSTSSLADAGGFQADMNLLAPLFQGTSAICVLFMPVLAASRATEEFRRVLRSLAVLLGLAGVAFWVLIAAFGDPLVRLTYGAAYLERADVLPWLASLCVLNAVAGVYGAGLRALERPDSVFWAYLAGSATLLVLGVALIPSGGLVGATVGSAIAWVVALFLLRRSCWREWRAASRVAARPRPRVLAPVAGEPVFDHPPRLEAPTRTVTPRPVASRVRTEAPTGPTRLDGTPSRGRTVGAVLALGPLCLLVLAFDRNGLFTRGGAVRNLLPLALAGVVAIAYFLAGQTTIRRPEAVDKVIFVLAGYLSLGFVMHLHRGSSGASDIAISIGLLVAATHLLARDDPSARQCAVALRNLCWAGAIYAGTFAAANAGLLGEAAPTFFKQMQSGLLIVPLVAAVATRRWLIAGFVAATYAYGFLHYSGADTYREAGHGGTYVVVAGVATLVYVATRGRSRTTRVLRLVGCVLLAVGAFLAVREVAPPSSSIASVTAAAEGGNESSTFRGDVWSAAVDEIAQRPLLGGQLSGSIVVTVDKYSESDLLVHNDLLQLAMDGGLPAAFLYLVVVIDVNRRALRGYQRLRGAGRGAHHQLLLTAFVGFDAFVVVGVFNPALFVPSLATVGFAMYALIRVLERVVVDVPVAAPETERVLIGT